MFEHRREPLLTRHQFAWRLAKSALAAVGIVAGSLAGGAVGYRVFERMGWVDALYNAAMILTGMGPAATLHSPQAKLFATAYALYSSVVLLGVVALLLGPIAHRVLHRFHLGDDETAGGRVG